MNLQYIIAFINFLIIKSNNNLSLTYTYTWNTPTLLINFPNDFISLRAYLNTFLPYSVFDGIDDFPDIIASHVIQDQNITLTENYNSFHYKTTLEVNNITISNFFQFVTNRRVHNSLDLGLALGYKFVNESYSIIHQLYNLNYIDHLLYTFEPLDGKGILHLGEIPEINRFPYTGHCKVEVGHFTWGCNLTGIKYNDRFYPFNIYSIFHSAYDEMFLSEDIFNFFVNEVLKDEIKEHGCVVRANGQETIKWMECSDRVDHLNLNDFSLFFGDMNVKIKLKDFFKPYSNRSLRVNVHKFNFYNNSIVIGFKFLQIFNLSVFNYENNLITFYSDKPKICMTSIKSNDKKILLSYFLYINDILLSFFSFYLIYVSLSIKFNYSITTVN